MSHNESARRAAQKAGLSTFTMEVPDYWPACVDCSTPIRRNIDPPPGSRRIGLFRACGCAGRVWWSCTEPWEIVADPQGGTP